MTFPGSGGKSHHCGAGARADGGRCARRRDARAAAARRRQRRRDRAAAEDGRAAARASRRLSGRAPGAERGRAVSGGGLGVWRACIAVREGSRHLLGLLKGSAPPPEVTVPTARRVPGVKTRRSCRLDAMSWRTIPVTTVARTLVDLAAELPADDLARACHEAGVRHGTTPAMVEAVLVRRGRTRGAAKLRAILLGDVRVTLSRLESRFLERLRGDGL